MNVRDSQAYKSIQTANESMSLIFELKEIFLSFQIIFSLAGVALVCAILNSTSGLKPWSVTTLPRYLNYQPLPISCPDVSGNASTLNCWSSVCLVSSALISMPKSERILSRWSSWEANSSSFPAKLRVSSQDVNCSTFRLECWLFPCDLPVLILSRNMLRRVDGSRQPCLTPTVVLNQSPTSP